MRRRCGLLAALALLAVLATSREARAQCSWQEQFWDGIQWVCRSHSLFPEVTLAPVANPYWRWMLISGGSNWRYYGWQPR